MKSIHLLATSLFFSAWSDRMWNFAVYLYLIKLTPGSLQLAAIYGLVSTCTSIILAPVIGDWVDNNARLKIVRWSLIIQNLLVVICAITVLLLLSKVTSIYSVIILLRTLMILLGASANLIGQGEKISITKDWIVVICKRDQNLLAQGNALLKRIDLSVAILAPMLIGFLMSLISDFSSVIFICLWNVFSFFAEYFLLLKIYKDVPELAEKLIPNEESETTLLLNENKNMKERESLLHKKKSVLKENLALIKRLKQVLLGWKVYKSQTVVLAGISLSTIYFTVLGFNAITTGFAYSEGLKEIYVSISFGLGSLFGIFGTFLFPFIVKRFGLINTGLVGFSLQWSMLLLCVSSIWAPGSNNLMHQSNNANTFSNNSRNLFSHSVTIRDNIASSNHILLNTPNINKLYKTNKIPQSIDIQNNSHKRDYTSIILLMSGVILSRTGLWIIDLTVTQLQQENVKKEERGVVSGVQYALNAVFDLGHFVLTILLPDPKQFCILIIASVSAITIGAVLYKIFTKTFRKFLLEEDDVNDNYEKI